MLMGSMSQSHPGNDASRRGSIPGRDSIENGSEPYSQTVLRSSLPAQLREESLAKANSPAGDAWTPEQRLFVLQRLMLLVGCAMVWMMCSYVDAKYTPRQPGFKLSNKLITAYGWCMVGYFCNLIITLLKVLFEKNAHKMTLHMVSCYISILAATSYMLLWTGISPILPDVHSCLYIPQRWLLYVHTAPAIIFILCQISDYTPRMRLWVILLNVCMLGAGGLGTIPWMSWPHKVFWYVMSCIPFPSILVHMWRMVSASVNEAASGEPHSQRSIKFIRIFSITTWNLFPVVYFGAIDGSFPLEVIEPLWAALDWLTKMVYSSSLMEANFFTIAQRREIVEKAVAEANRLQTIQQLSVAIERKDDFLSTMSHELRTPLNGIIGLSESLLAGSAGLMADKAIQTISTIGLSGKRLLQLINDILDAAKMKQGIMVIKHERVDIERLVADVLDLTLPLVRKGVKLVNNVRGVPKIVGDTGRIVQILYNLVGNAAKFTPVGTISINAGVAECGTKVYVAVTDTGVGIAKDKIGSIFGAFEQADMSTTRRYGGTGLGLHLVKELVKAHNGEITVESVISKGSTFKVLLPISQDGSDVPLQSDPASLRGPTHSDLDEGRRTMEGGSMPSYQMSHDMMRPKSKSVEFQSHFADYPAPVVPLPTIMDSTSDDALLSVSEIGFKVTKPFYHEKHGSCMILSVDDDLINQYVVEELLTLEGYKVEKAMSGNEALEFLSSSPTLPDVILLDVMMPDMNGMEVCAKVRNLYSTVSIPIIMVSANISPEQVTKGLESGSVDYVKKPFNRQELISRVRAQIRNREFFEAEMQTRKVTERLKSIMPMSVIQRLLAGQSMIADRHPEVTVLFVDVGGLGFSPESEGQLADVILLMNKTFSVFERLLTKYNVFRVEYTGDCYMVVSGHDGTKDHVMRMLALAKDMFQCTSKMSVPDMREPLQLRIGIHCGPAHAGVVGVENPRYCVFGDTVIIANSLQMRCPANCIMVSEAVVDRSGHEDRFAPYIRSMTVASNLLQTYLCKLGDYVAALDAMNDSDGGGKGANLTDIASKRAVQRMEQMSAQLASMSEEKRLLGEKLSSTVEDQKRAQIRAKDLSRQLAEAQQEIGRLSKLASAASSQVGGSHAGGAGLSSHALRSHHHRSSTHDSVPQPRGPASDVSGGDSMMHLVVRGMRPDSEVSSQMDAGGGNSFWGMSYSLELFLRDIGLQQYLDLLAAQEVTPLVLSGMTEKDLQEIGITAYGARKRILDGAQQYAAKLNSMTRMMLMYKDGALPQQRQAGMRYPDIPEEGINDGGGEAAGSSVHSDGH